MKSIFKKIAFVLALAMVVTAFPAMTAAAADGPQASASVKCYLGESDTAKIKTWNRTGMTRSFSVADASIATVDKATGDVTGVKVGKTTVSCEFTSKATGKVVAVTTTTVNVMRSAKEVALGAKGLEEIKFADGKGTMQAGDSIELIKYVYRANGSIKAWGNAKTAITDSVQILTSDKSVISVTGKTVKAEAAGTATLTINARKWVGGKAKYAVTATKAYEIVVTDGIDAKATGVKEITVYGNFAKDAKFTVKKDNRTTVNHTASISADGTTAVLALATKLTKGTYVVASGEQTVELVAEDEKVTEIIVKENGSSVVTDNDGKEIIVHYDVLNQYGESVRKSYAIEWTSSFGKRKSDDRERGVVVFADTKAINYSFPITLIGVYAKHGASITASMTAGLENFVSEVKVEGVLKQDTTTILKELPADFTNGDYVLVYSMKDRYGYDMKFDATQVQYLSFNSMSPLLLTLGNKNTVVLDGETYGTVEIEPNEYYSTQGGIADIRIISNKTGKETPYLLTVVSNQILESFTMFEPDGILAEGEVAVIPYEAFDTTGKPVNNFRVLSEYLTIVGNDNLVLVENNDGSASLLYKAPDGVATDDSDYTVVLMSNVARANNSCNITMTVKEKARVNAIRGMHMGDGNGFILEHGSILLGVGAPQAAWVAGNYWLTYYDQYDREIGEWENTGLKYGLCGDYWTNKSGRFEIKVKYDGDALDISTDVNDRFEKYVTIKANAVTNTMQTETVEFYLFDKEANDGKGDVVSGSSKKFQFTIVDISKAAGFTMGATNNYMKNGVDSTKFNVKATLSNGVSGVPVPNDYITYAYTIEDKNAGTPKKTVTGTAIGYGPTFTEAPLDDSKANMFIDYAVTNSDKTHPNKSVEVKATATIKNLDGKLVDSTPTTTMKVAIDKKKVVSFVKNGDTGHVKWIDSNANKAYFKADSGEVTYGALMEVIAKYKNNYGDEDEWKNIAKVTDTVGVKSTVAVTKLTPTVNGIHPESGVKAAQINISSCDNGTDKDTVMLSNVEIGDTFIATYTCEDATLVVYFTVGSDNTAAFTSTGKKLIWK